MQLKIRKATKDDGSALLDLLEEARKYKVSLGDLAWGDYPFTEEDVALRLKSNNCYVVVINDQLAGSVMLLWDDEHNWGQKGIDGQAGYVHGLVVSNSFRGQKLGEQIIDWVIAQVREQKRLFVRLDCPAENTGLCSYYEKLGFKRIKTTDNTAFYERAV